MPEQSDSKMGWKYLSKAKYGVVVILTVTVFLSILKSLSYQSREPIIVYKSILPQDKIEWQELEKPEVKLEKSEDYTMDSKEYQYDEEDEEGPSLNRGIMDFSQEILEIEKMKEDALGRKKRLPSVIHIGERKTGTTALLHFLAQHPHLKAPEREVHFFDLYRNYIRGIEWYVDQMPSSTSEDVTFEKSPSYFRNHYAPRRMQAALPHVKLILSVRDPIKRAISDFHFSRSAPWPCGFDKKKFDSFEEYVLDTQDGSVNATFAPLVRSQYSVNMNNWLEYFDLKNFYIFDGDAFIDENPAHELSNLEEFMGLPPYFKPKMFFFSQRKQMWCLRDPGCIFFGGKEHPAVDSAVIKDLKVFFKSHNDGFFKLIGKKFDW